MNTFRLVHVLTVKKKKRRYYYIYCDKSAIPYFSRQSYKTHRSRFLIHRLPSDRSIGLFHRHRRFRITTRVRQKQQRKQGSEQISMEGVGGGDGASAATLDQWRQFSRLFQFYLDKTTPHAVYRWAATAGLLVLYALRVYYVQGFYIITYGLGIYILNLLIGFLSPLVDPELEPSDGPLLPTKGSDEFKPFIRRLPEFKFWYAITKAFIISFLMTFFSMFDVPVFWPILLCYWFVLFTLTMKRQIMHMIKYRYVPFNIGKQKYGGRKASAGNSSGSRAE